jgi:hypothetical protein
MAAFTTKDPADRDAFMARWTRILGDETITMQTILFDGQVVGSVLSFEESGRRELTLHAGRGPMDSQTTHSRTTHGSV